LDLLSKEKFQLVLCDFRLEDTDGREILKKVKELYPQTGVIIITGYSDIKLAVELIKMGAYDYITKPLYPDEILNTISKAIDLQDTIFKSDTAAAPLRKEKTVKTGEYPDEFIIGESTASKELIKQLDLISPTNYSVILTGESGTGKESIAHAYLIWEVFSTTDEKYIR